MSNEAEDPHEIMQAQRKRRRRFYVLIGVVLVLAGGVFGAGAWTAYQVGYSHGKQAAAPVINSDSQAVRVQPDDSGGRQVENKDSEVYSLLSQQEGEPENLLVPEKQAASSASGSSTTQLAESTGGESQASTSQNTSGDSQASAGQSATSDDKKGDGQASGSTGSGSADSGSGSAGAGGNAIESEKLKEPQAGESGEIENLIKEEVKEKTTPGGQTASGQAAQSSSASSATSGGQESAAASSSQQASDTAAASGGESGAAAPESKPSEGSGSGSASANGSASGSGSGTQVASKPEEPQAKWRIQVGSVSERSAAEQEWQRLQERYSDLLGELEATYRRADLGADGVYHRIQVGPLTESKARELCAQLSQKGQGCLVVAP